jgi:hypothetical protein
VLGPEGRSLLIGRPANLRRWLGSQLGLGRPSRAGGRPPLDLSPVAAAVRYATTRSGFQQRLAYERLMAPHVPLRARRDLRPPAYLRLDPAERFPRLAVRVASGAPRGERSLFGPFRDRRAATRALETLHRRFPLRPCDYTFEPDPALPLGLGCVFAQMRTCAAPCLGRIGEDDYRRLASDVAAVLGAADARPEDLAAALPSWVGTPAGARGLVVEAVAGVVEAYPVHEGAVLEEHGVAAPAGELAAALEALRWHEPPVERHDWPWLLSWLHAPRRRGAYLPVGVEAEPADLARRVEDALLAQRAGIS